MAFLARLAPVLWLCACGHWNGEAEYHPSKSFLRSSPSGAVSFGIGLPGRTWRPYPEKESGVQVAWLRKGKSAVIQVRSQCAEHGDSTLEMFTEHIGADFGDWKVREVKTGKKDRRGRPEYAPVQSSFRLVGRTALRSTIDANLDGVPITLEVVVVKKNGCLFDLTYISPPSSYASGLKDFDKVVAGFRFPLGRKASKP